MGLVTGKTTFEQLLITIEDAISDTMGSSISDDNEPTSYAAIVVAERIFEFFENH